MVIVVRIICLLTAILACCFLMVPIYEYWNCEVTAQLVREDADREEEASRSGKFLPSNCYLNGRVYDNGGKMVEALLPLLEEGESRREAALRYITSLLQQLNSVPPYYWENLEDKFPQLEAEVNGVKVKECMPRLKGNESAFREWWVRTHPHFREFDTRSFGAFAMIMFLSLCAFVITFFVKRTTHGN